MQYKKARHSGDLMMELVRKGVHIVSGILIVLGLETNLFDASLVGFLALVMGALILYNYRYEREILTKILSINRADAKIPGLSAFVYLIGCWLVLALFDQRIAFAAILILAFGDPLAHLVGRGFGATLAAVTPATYMLGTAAGIVAGTFAAWLYVPFWHAFVASAVAMFIEAGELRIAEHYVDDNFTIPIVAGLVLWIAWLAFPF